MGLFCFGLQKTTFAQLTILHNFADGSVRPDAAYPVGALIQASDGTFFGVARGHSGSFTDERTGDVYQFTPPAGVKVVQEFPHSRLASPFGPLLFYRGDLVGAFYDGPKWSGKGAVFRLRFSRDTGEWRTVLLHRFLSTAEGDGANPSAPLIVGTDGFLYGTTDAGGILDGGTIFKLERNGKEFSVLHRFRLKSEGTSPGGLLLGSDGNYYGTTGYGPGTNLFGTIFMMTPAGKMTTLYTFPFESLDSGLIEGNDGNFYGVTALGGSFEFGTVFKMTPDHTVTILRSFGQGQDGRSPGVVQGPNGNLYGVCSYGGTANNGTVFEMSTDGSSYTVLHNFGDGSIPNDGSLPIGLVLGSDNYFYGVTEFGGTAKEGTIFRISP